MLQMAQGVGGRVGALITGPRFPHLLNEDVVSMALTGLQGCGSALGTQRTSQTLVVPGIALGGRGGTRFPLVPSRTSHTLCSWFRPLLYLGWSLVILASSGQSLSSWYSRFQTVPDHRSDASHLSCLCFLCPLGLDPGSALHQESPLTPLFALPAPAEPQHVRPPFRDVPGAACLPRSHTA